ncbi:MAG TPA: AzlC family ABC transporter permease [Microvirga sp.]|jgi:4-azaleucine resistance transporter AzlC|nr:AzlC family ABC transporter permease [Microvirga sp.]
MDQANPLIGRKWTDVRDGVRDVAPAAIAALPIGLLFGAIAAAKGLSAAEVALMSTLVFAGGAQFAAIETWVHPAPVAALAFSALLINARHILMGASLAPKLRVSRGRKFVAMHFLTDETWALAERRAVDGPVTGAYWFAMAAVLPVAWIGSSSLGAVLGPLLGDPARLGADFAFTALFIGLIASFGRARVTLVTIAVSGAVAAVVYRIAGAPWHVAAGALAGIAAAYAAAGDGARRESRP